ncbi:hypothetical protein J1N35_002481 [Gossypium stocksii]|uniref:Aminotransferase-like plant mobile domain-containing protein n=1 Tax=Gossypium stocksii TaxID=47602 RepID=A0A9D4ANJ6_9ROSI|nr:hypothetical protein J1N35_002481 [Gossypium stocksii]
MFEEEEAVTTLGLKGIGRSYTFVIYRQMIETHAREGFVWMPYSASDIATVIPSSSNIHSHLWCINAPLLKFSTVDWWNRDRVLRQFRCKQNILDVP